MMAHSIYSSTTETALACQERDTENYSFQMGGALRGTGLSGVPSAHGQACRAFGIFAELFGGVEIRWTCDKSLIKGTDVPEEAKFHFENGLRDYLTQEIEGHTLVNAEPFFGSAEKKGLGKAEWAVAWTAEHDGTPRPARRSSTQPGTSPANAA
jgi:hypothetical protein